MREVRSAERLLSLHFGRILHATNADNQQNFLGNCANPGGPNFTATKSK